MPIIIIKPQAAAMTTRIIIIGINPGATRTAIRVITLLAAAMMTIMGPDTHGSTNKFNNTVVLLPENNFLEYICGIDHGGIGQINNGNFYDNIDGYYN